MCFSLNLYFKIACKADVVCRSIKVMLIVGTILVLINKITKIIALDFTWFDWV